MIKLKNVSKFYYSKGVIASGFTKVNLEFKMGEFVVITGESGSGKSTLLNVISGLDSYEEGEMYINSKETSHYTEKDFEEYRRKYIGNIFQNFNLVNSYTVYQNVELVLLLNGYKKNEVKQKVLEIIKKVGLEDFKNTKASKLSGGQKQRVAIARCLAKDTPIIIADEPTGNLDSKSAESIIELLSELSKDKLVVIVTHNYEQVEKYVTRKIKMHDGRVLEDKTINEPNKVNKKVEVTYNNITGGNTFRLGTRNAFNVIPKFILVLLVYLFISIALVSEYSSFQKQKYLLKTDGYNYFFNDVSDKRAIVKKKDKTPFTDEEYKKIREIPNVESVLENDLLIDTVLGFTNDNLYIYGSAYSLDTLKGKLDVGRMPENDNEVVLEGYENSYYLSEMRDQLMKSDLYMQDIDNTSDNVDTNTKIRVVGIKYYKDSMFKSYSDSKIYAKDELLDKLKYQINKKYSKTTILFMNKYNESNSSDNNYKIVPTDRVPKGEAYISEDLKSMYDNQNILNKQLKIEVNNMYYNDSLSLNVSKLYTKANMEKLLGVNNFNDVNGSIYINNQDYDSLYSKASYQSSVFVKDAKAIDEVVKSLNDMNISALKVVDTLDNGGTSEVIQLLSTIVTIGLVITLFFISYFIIRIVLKSRNVYFSIIRMLGASKKVSKRLLIIELLAVSNLAFLVVMLFLVLGNFNILNIGIIDVALEYLKLTDYVLLYAILTGISYLISVRFAKNLFKNSAMSTMREEV